MLNIKKAITVSGILNNLVSLSLILLFCWLGNAYAQMPPALDFPPGREFDPRHPLEPRESGISPSAHKTKSLVSEANISENVELVGAIGTYVYDVFVQDNYAYVCTEDLIIFDVSAPSNPTYVGYVALPDLAYGVYVQGGLAYVAYDDSGLRIIDVSVSSSQHNIGNHKLR